MNSIIQVNSRKIISLPVPIEGLISALNNIQSKIDKATGIAAALEMRLRIVGELVPEVQEELKKTTNEPYYKADLYYLIPAVLTVFKDELNPEENDLIKSCRPPRNKLSHASFVEFMLAVKGKAPGREIDPKTGKRKPLKKENLIEGVLSLEKSQGLEEFCKNVNKSIEIIDRKILRSLG